MAVEIDRCALLFQAKLVTCVSVPHGVLLGEGYGRGEAVINGRTARFPLVRLASLPSFPRQHQLPVGRGLNLVSQRLT